MPLVGFNIDQWHSIIIYMNGDKFNVYMTKNNLFETNEKIFASDIIDTDIKIGLVGLSTYKTTAHFSDISLQPFDNLDVNNDLLYVDLESQDCNFYFN